MKNSFSKQRESLKKAIRNNRFELTYISLMVVGAAIVLISSKKSTKMSIPIAAPDAQQYHLYEFCAKVEDQEKLMPEILALMQKYDIPETDFLSFEI